MKRAGMAHSNPGIADYLLHLPKKMVSLYPRENICEFVLYDLCNERCFNLNKAAYFVDNADFNYYKGMAGFSHDESYHNGTTPWENPEEFTAHMQQSPFNQLVRQCIKDSHKKSPQALKEFVQSVATDFHFDGVDFCVWDMKHDNQGILIFEQQEKDGGQDSATLEHGVHLLSFCPLF